MLVGLRRRPVLLAGIVLFVFFIFMHQSSNEYVAKIPGHDYLQRLPAIVSDNWHGDLSSSQHRLDAPLEDAHLLTDPDDFLPHFDAVARLPQMTLAEAQSGCTWGKNDKVNFQFGMASEMAQNPHNDTVISERRTRLHDYVRTELVPWSKAKGKFEGRGIVTLGGNEEGKTFKRMLVILNALKKTGCELPIEVAYWGDEFSDDNRGLIQKHYPKVYFHDLSSKDNIIQITKHMMPNFQFKIAALLNSRFAEPLFLDSDNLAIFDPEQLWESKTYKEYGTIFWPDIARTLPMNPIWPITNTKCRMDEYEQESGQLLVDKRKYWYHLQLSLYFLDKEFERFFYSRVILGDKDAFRMAWHALKTKFGYPAKWLSSVGTIRNDSYYCGHTFAQYHPDASDGRVAFFHGGLLKSFNKKYVNMLRNGPGIFQVHKSSPVPEQHGANPTEIMIGIMTADGYVPHEDDGQRVAFCTQFNDIEARPLDELVPHFEQTYRDIDGYWIMEQVE